jgi:tRNA(Glu) U13 pseudouridine synthase TruD
VVEKRSRKQRLEAKVRRLKAKLTQEILAPERVVLFAIPVMIVFFMIGTISSLMRNWELQQEIIERKTTLAYLKVQVENDELENDYYASEEYQELAARKLQNKKQKGETMIALPKNSDEAKNKHKENTAEEKAILNEKTNFDQWMTFLFNL